MKREQHKANIKGRVLQVAKELFHEKGYAKTPISEITGRAGITTGSLYHFFKNKEDILLHLTQEMFDLTILMADQMAGENANPWVRLYMEIAMQFSLVLKHGTISEMYLTAHESGLISTAIARRAHERNLFLFRPVMPDLSDDDVFGMTLATKGIIHSFIQNAFYAEGKPHPALTKMALDLILTVFRLPAEKKAETDAAIKELIGRFGDMFVGLDFPHK